VKAKSLNVVHQPVAWIWSLGRIDVMARPTVGTSQITEIASSARWTGVRAMKRRRRSLTVPLRGRTASAATLT
jgi:hypothetical protein